MGQCSVKNAIKKQLVVGENATLSTNYADMGGAYAGMWLDIPTMPSNTTITIYGSVDTPRCENIDFKEIWQSDILITTHAVFQISSAITNSLIAIPPGFQMYKVNMVNSITSDITYTFYGYDTIY